jgi:TRAP-type C4-dicarboxylate transport system substrate-binding protein
MPRAWGLSCLVVLALLATLLHEGEVAAPAGRGKVVLKFSHNQPTITIPHQAAVLFKQLVEARTEGY